MLSSVRNYSYNPPYEIDEDKDLVGVYVDCDDGLKANSNDMIAMESLQVKTAMTLMLQPFFQIQRIQIVIIFIMIWIVSRTRR